MFEKAKVVVYNLKPKPVTVRATTLAPGRNEVPIMEFLASYAQFNNARDSGSVKVKDVYVHQPEVVPEQTQAEVVPEKVDYMQKFKKELVALCEERNLSTEGNKADLAKRLGEND